MTVHDRNAPNGRTVPGEPPRDELGKGAERFRLLQRQIADAAQSLDSAREDLRAARAELVESEAWLENANLDLRQAKAAAEAERKAKGSFLAVMGHELRTPLNAILGFSEIMSMEASGPLGTLNFGEYAKHIHQSGSHLLSVINELLDMAKIGSGEFALSECLVDVVPLVSECLLRVQHLADAKDITLMSEVDSNIGRLHADEARVRQILANILSNAVKFTPANGLVCVVAGLDDQGSLCFRVIDTGIGMTEDQIATARLPFRQVDSSLARKYEGAGMGLPLAERLMKLHGGKLDINSQIDVGTTVVVTFPAARMVAPVRATGS